MKKDEYNIGKLVKESNINKETIRYYEKIGLLSETKRDKNGYRLYSEEDIEKIKFVLIIKKFGFSLREISTLMHNEVLCGDITSIRKLVGNKINEINSKMNELIETKNLLEKVKKNILADRIFIKTTDKIVKNLHLRDKDFWVDDNCNGCRLCEKICPVNNIQFNINKPTWKHNCEQCSACIQYCPNEAIQWRTKTKKRRRYRNPNISINELIGY